MILVTRLNKQHFFLNSDLIELLEETPDTLITMTTGKKFIVEESAETVINKIVEYKNLCFREVNLRVSKTDNDSSHLGEINETDELSGKRIL